MGLSRNTLPLSHISQCSLNLDHNQLGRFPHAWRARRIWWAPLVLDWNGIRRFCIVYWDYWWPPVWVPISWPIFFYILIYMTNVIRGWYGKIRELVLCLLTWICNHELRVFTWLEVISLRLFWIFVHWSWKIGILCWLVESWNYLMH